jgi:YfiH family protein
VALETVIPDWPAPGAVRALVTTRSMGDMSAGAQGRIRLRPLLPAEPVWLRQVHGAAVALLENSNEKGPQADAAVTRRPGTVCLVTVADCMPVLFADEDASVVAAAHAGWRGLAAGVIEATLEAMRVPAARVLAWLGPAIGPRAYEVGDEVREAFLAGDAAAASAFVAARPGHWRLDLYAVARQRLAARGVARVSGGGFCTYSEQERYFSWRRERAPERMAAAIWLA